MTTITSFLKRYPLLAYLALTFAISWGGIFIVSGSGRFPASGQELERLILYSYAAMLAGPGLAGILLTVIVSGRAGLSEFLARLLKWRVGAGWYAVALLTAPLVILVVLFALSLISPDFLPRLFVTDDKVFLLWFSVISGLLVGIFEELGWTGFAAHTLLRSRRSILGTGLIVGLWFAAWDFLVVFRVSDSTSAAGTVPLALFLPASLFTWLPAYRVLMVWVYDHTGSLLVAMLMHTSLVVFWTSLTPLPITGMPLVTYYLGVTAVMWVVIAVVLRLQTLHQSRFAVRGDQA